MDIRPQIPSHIDSEIKLVKLDYEGSPLDLFTKFYEHFEYVYILESVEGPEKLAEYSFIGFDPRFVINVKEKRAEVYDMNKNECMKKVVSDPLPLVKSIVEKICTTQNNSIRFIGGAVGYISYDAIRYWEKLPKIANDDLKLPDLELAIYNDGIVFDHKTREVFYYYLDKSRLKEIECIVNGDRDFEALSHSELRTNIKKEDFENMVIKVKDYINFGDIFQVVLSRRYEFNFKGSLIPFYKVLRTINPSPYMYFLKMGSCQIVGSSPEMLVRVENGIIETFPIAGTKPRVKNDAKKDEALAQELIQDPKERAEHVMLVDLARNDIGRISEFGSVHVPEFMKVYKYSHVQHIVSHVVGRLRRGCSCYDVLRVVFPAGTVSGAPKVRAMEIIEECEPVRRGPYAGAVGYFSYNGNADFAITIRTLIAKGDKAYIQVGAGIVADSIPENEWLETEYKASALIKALQFASECNGYDSPYHR
ncbi:MAG: anthranilate synthase component I [Nitrososphaerales archaeon]|nr:anthranilate synthase component I [Nitrososphaerales archaeon]MCX8191830.1 anthranilate synthase component I [Nitrososphaerales archaeon]